MGKIVKFEARNLVRADAFRNPLTGYGTSRDHGQQFHWSFKPRLGKMQLDDMRARHELIWKITDLLPLNALRKGLDFPKLEEKQKRLIRKVLRDCKLLAALKKALPLDRLHGGVALYIRVDDGLRPDEPVDFSRIKKISEVKVLESDYLIPENMTRSMMHTHYLLYDPGATEGFGVRIHKSRLIFAPGIGASDDWILSNNGKPPSVVDRCLDAVVAYTTAHGLVPNILKDIIRDVIKLAGFNDLTNDMCTDDTAVVDFHGKLDAMFQAESLLNKTVIDAEDDFVRQTTSTQGVPEMIGLPGQRLVAASGMPHTILLGEKPGASIGEGGTSQRSDWQESTEIYQADQVAPMLDEFMPFLEAVTGIDEIEYIFPSLSVLTKSEQGILFEKIANAVAKLVDMGIITPQEAATAFESEEIKVNITLDLLARAGLTGLSQQLLNASMGLPESTDTPPQTPLPQEATYGE